MLEHAALLHATCVRGEDGFSAWARVRGRACGQRLIGFGECVYWKPPLKGPQHDLDGNMGPRLKEGMFVGYKRHSNSYLIIDKSGDVVESRAVQRKPIEQRWLAETVEAVKVTPWSLRSSLEAKRVPFGEAVPELEKAEDKIPAARRLKNTM